MLKWLKKLNAFEKGLIVALMIAVGAITWVAFDIEEVAERQYQENIDWRISQLSLKKTQGAIVFHEVEEKLLLVQSDKNLVVFFTTDTGNHAPYNFNALIVKKERDREWFGDITKVVRQGTLEYASAKEGFTVAAFDKMLRNK